MKTETGVRDAVRSFVCAQILAADSGAGEITDDTELVQRGIVDSINVLRIVDFVEENWEILLEPEDIYQFTTIERIAAIVQSKRSA